MYRKIVIVVVSFALSLNAFSQQKEFKDNIKGINDKVDSLPYFIYDKPEFDSLLLWTLVLPSEADMLGINSDVKMSFTVDSQGKISKIKMVDCKTKLNRAIEARDDNTLIELNKKFIFQATQAIQNTSGLWKVDHVSDTAQWLTTIVKFISLQYDLSNEKSRSNKSTGNVMHYGAPMSQFKLKELYNVGVAKLNQSKYSLAIKYFDVAVLHNPDDIDAYYNQGVSYVKLKDYQSACKSFQEGKKHGDSGTQDLINKYCK